ncbi:MAG: low specificity L-threonine aldolase [Lachnospiraceae bacterium]|nr:low specificity L-threonine aldolase [Lachnospiraceae bacterium]
MKLFFASDYMEGAHPLILERLGETNTVPEQGYGLDAFSESAREKIRDACQAPGADVFFLTGGTQTNALVIGALLLPYQGVIAADTGHISAHEAGAIEAGGHKVLTLSHSEGKITADAIGTLAQAYREDMNHDHMVMPGMVYLSQPTEYGTLYSLKELHAIRQVCDTYGLSLYVDGARLAYALGCAQNDVSLADLARLTDVFYIGGTKCGALLGEAVVIPVHDRIPHFFTIIKQKGALLAKGRSMGIAFDVLFTDDLYLRIGMHGVAMADRIRAALTDCGYEQVVPSPTNQIFVRLTNAQLGVLSGQAEMSFWERTDATHTVMRLATGWATRTEDVDALVRLLNTVAASRSSDHCYFDISTNHL